MGELIDDLAKLPSIDDSVVMETLHLRHQADHIYTKNGAVLVAINPYKNVGVADESHLVRYKTSMALENEPPHIFAVAAAGGRPGRRRGLCAVLAPHPARQTCAPNTCVKCARSSVPRYGAPGQSVSPREGRAYRQGVHAP